MLLSSALCVNAQSTKQLRDSLEVLRKALDVNPSSTDLCLKKAAVEIELGEWDRAIADYSAVLTKYPTNPAALFYRAYAYDKVKRYRFARSDYQDLLRITPFNFEARMGLALVNQRDKHFTEAFDQINQLVEQYPDSVAAYVARAGIEKERGFIDASLLDWSEAIKRDAKNPDYHISRADIYLLLNKRDYARKDLDEAVRLGVNRASLVEQYKRCK